MVAETRKKFTIAEYHKLGDLGFFDQSDRLELIRGEIITMAPKRTPHSVCNSLLWKQLYRLIGEQTEIRVQEPISLLGNSEPEPDVVIAKKKEDNYLSAHPTAEDLILVIEISDSTLKYDRETKLSLYAEAGINHYWIINLVDNHLEAYTNPFVTGAFVNGAFVNGTNYGYRQKNIYLANEAIAIPEFLNLSLQLSSIFPQ